MRKGKNFLSPKKTHCRAPSWELSWLQPGSWLSRTTSQALAQHICSLSVSAAFAIVMWISQYCFLIALLLWYKKNIPTLKNKQNNCAMKDKFDYVNPDDLTHLEAKMLQEFIHLLMGWFHIFMDWHYNTKFYTGNTPVWIWLGRTQGCFPPICPWFLPKIISLLWSI